MSNSMLLCGGKLLDPVKDVLDAVRRARALVFDFDGTLVDSEPVKKRAFEACFAEFPDHRRAILSYCWGNNWHTREQKFRYVYEQILGLPFTDEVANRLERRFAELTTRQTIEAPEIPGASRFLTLTAASHTKSLLSNTPHAILIDIVESRGWGPHFDVIQGAPVAKGEWLGSYRRSIGLAGHEVVFFGDTVEDAGAAKAAGCTFVAIGDAVSEPEAGHHVRDFTALWPSEGKSSGDQDDRA